MKYFFKLGFVLLVITVIASGVLAYINSITKPIIEENQRKAKEEARMEVLPEAATFDSISYLNEETVYISKNEEGNIVGYTFIASLYGYSSDVKTMVGVTPDLKVNRIKIIEQKETPGLGANCEKPEFQQQFENKNKSEMTVDKDGGNIISITGATITTRTLAQSIKLGLGFIEGIAGKIEIEEATKEEVTE
jgi:electron transport complex protein RnfG